MDDQQRARGLRKQAAKILGDAYNAAHFFGAADDALSETPSPHCQVTITAITAALRAAPEGLVLVPRELTLDMLEAAEQEFYMGNDFADAWDAAIATYLAASPQGVKDA